MKCYVFLKRRPFWKIEALRLFCWRLQTHGSPARGGQSRTNNISRALVRDVYKRGKWKRNTQRGILSLVCRGVQRRVQPTYPPNNDFTLRHTPVPGESPTGVPHPRLHMARRVLEYAPVDQANPV